MSILIFDRALVMYPTLYARATSSFFNSDIRKSLILFLLDTTKFFFEQSFREFEKCVLFYKRVFKAFRGLKCPCTHITLDLIYMTSGHFIFRTKAALEALRLKQNESNSIVARAFDVHQCILW